MSTFPPGKILKYLITWTQCSLFSDYMICCDPMYNLDIPDHYTSTANYAATLAHKVFLSFSAIFMKSVVIKRALIHLLIAQACHSFTPNSSFVNLYHPRFANILLPIMIWMLLLSNEYIQCNKGALGLNICRLVRFGKIMSIIALRDLHPGEEILVSLCSNFFVEIESFPSFFCHLFSVTHPQVCYNYKLEKAPQWYQNNWIQHLM